FGKLGQVCDLPSGYPSRPKLKVGIELEREISGVAQTVERVDCRLVRCCASPISRVGEGLFASPEEIEAGSIPPLRPHCVMGQKVDVFAASACGECLQGRQNAFVKRPAAFTKQTLVGDLQRQRMLEGVLQLWEKAALIEELGRPQMIE